MSDEFEAKLSRLQAIIKVRNNLRRLKSQTVAGLGLLVRDGQELTPEIEEMLHELRRVSNEFEKPIQMTEKFLLSASKELVNFL